MKRKRKKRQTVLDVLDDGFQTVMEGRDISSSRPDTPQAKTWVSLEPGWTVTEDGREIVITQDAVKVH